MFEELQWSNEPATWHADDDRLVVTPEAETDFWRETFYGFVHDNGHFYHRDVHGDFTAEVTLVGGYQHLYDQSGLMVRGDEQHWLKAGLELTDGAVHMSTVLTRDTSDWAVLALPSFDGRLRLRLTRHGDAIRVEFALPGGDWQLQRLGYLPLPETCTVGLMCCAPVQAGFEAGFEGFAVSEPISRDLHG
jgi:regulation of enolase protein 1 (concanavalin A-like superfamily)